MRRREDKDIRFYVDLDLKNLKIIGWDYDDRHKLAQTLSNSFHHRVFLTKGQYNKLERKILETGRGGARSD